MISENKSFEKAALTLAAILIFAAGILIMMYMYSSIQLFNSILLLFSTLLLMLAAFIAVFIFFIARNIKKNDNSSRFRLVYRTARFFLYPIIKPVAKLIKIDTRQLERFFIEINNQMVEAEDSTFGGSQIVLLLPHCLQDNKCNVNITHDINNCRRCGKCDIKGIIEIGEKYGITPIVVTGGTAARSRIAKLRPSAVVAVACERDLASGINDVKGIPVYGVLNMRPNGPCNNTKVDLGKIEQAIEQLVAVKGGI